MSCSLGILSPRCLLRKGRAAHDIGELAVSYPAGPGSVSLVVFP